jgi:site-specific DNA-cytosine methylase
MALVRWQDHAETSAMRDTLRCIGHTKPASFVLENVVGLTDAGHGDTLSPLEFITQELQGYGYQVRSFEVALDTWVTVSRNRTP